MATWEKYNFVTVSFQGFVLFWCDTQMVGALSFQIAATKSCPITHTEKSHKHFKWYDTLSLDSHSGGTADAILYIIRSLHHQVFLDDLHALHYLATLHAHQRCFTLSRSCLLVANVTAEQEWPELSWQHWPFKSEEPVIFELDVYSVFSMETALSVRWLCFLF